MENKDKDMVVPKFQEFLQATGTMKTHLYIGNPHLEANTLISRKIKQSESIVLDPVFSHLTFLLVETLANTGHGEFSVSSKSMKFEIAVTLGSQVKYRYKLKKEQMEDIQRLYEQITDKWILWRNNCYRD